MFELVKLDTLGLTDVVGVSKKTTLSFLKIYLRIVCYVGTVFTILDWQGQEIGEHCPGNEDGESVTVQHNG